MTYAPEQTNPNQELAYEPEQLKDILPSLDTELARNDMFCLHGVALLDVGRNSQLPGDTSFEERFRIVVEESPTISAVVHTDDATTSKAVLWSDIGLVIGGGSLQAASPIDMSSVMTDDGSRYTPEQSAQDISAVIDQIAASDAKYPDHPQHNEVVVSEPVIKALYFKDMSGLMPHQIDQSQPVFELNVIPKPVLDAAVRHSLPVFALRTSGVYRVDRFDERTGKYRFSIDGNPRVHPSEVVNYPKVES